MGAGSEGAALQRAREDASRAAESAFTRQRAFLHQAGTYHGQGGALGGHMAPLGEPAGNPLHLPASCVITTLLISLAVEYPFTSSAAGYAGIDCTAQMVGTTLCMSLLPSLFCSSKSNECHCAEGALAQKVVGSFAAAWPSMQAVLVLPCPGVAELREVAARCCTLAMRADRSAAC